MYSITIMHSLFVLFIYLFIYSFIHSFIYWKLNGVVYIIMVTTTRMRWHSLCCTFCLQIFWSEIVLECIFISAIRVLQFLRQVLFVFHLAGQLISLLTYLGKRKLNWEKGCLFELGRSCLTVRQNISLNPTFICPHCLHSKTTLSLGRMFPSIAFEVCFLLSEKL